MSVPLPLAAGQEDGIGGNAKLSLDLGIRDHFDAVAALVANTGGEEESQREKGEEAGHGVTSVKGGGP